MSLPDPSAPDDHVPFSASEVWQDLRRFYQTQGIAAWDDKVPFMASSHALLAESYSQAIRTFWLEALPAPSLPLIVLELGAGHGAFSFALLQRLCQWRERTGQTFPFVYIMSDLAEANVAFWRSHPALAPYVERKCLDFAVWNAETDAPLVTEIQAIRLDPAAPCAQPLVVVANYLFDSLACEYLQVKDDVMYRGWMPRDPALQMAVQETHFLLPSLRFFPMQEGELRDPHGLLPGLGAAYAGRDDAASFLFPASAIGVLDHFRSIAGATSLFLVADKGSARPRASLPAAAPVLAIHHSLSAEVPFDILSDWARRCGGDPYVTVTGQPVQQAGFLFAAQAMPCTRELLRHQFVSCPAGDVFTLMQALAERGEEQTLRTLIACLNACQWDTFVFDNLYPSLRRRLALEPQLPQQLADLLDGIARIDAQYYAFPGRHDTFGHIGQLLHMLGQSRAAIHFYQRARTEGHDLPATRLAIGECLLALEDWRNAQGWFEAVLEEVPGHYLALGYLDTCREKSALAGGGAIA
ncbi:hypothetical protein [Herbaspirillum sp. RV1423]|uniref:hypothetical protein n=1 Tax=Herbaspirillum sp. RV1423 TaxID=1443993 RepID=UPI0004AEE829|nr:hypothetical protein [Herbaspirillum sp. RV1423]